MLHNIQLFFLLFLLILSGKNFAINCKILTLENRWHEGQLGRIVERPPSLMLLQDKGWKRFNCREIIQISIQPAIITSSSTTILTRDGSKLYGEIVGGDQQIVEFRSAALGSISIPIKQLQEIQFEPNLPTIGVEKNQDTLYFKDGDKLVGNLESFGEGFVKIQHPRLGLRQEPFSKLRRIIIGEFKNPPKKNNEGLRGIVISTDNCELNTRIVRCEDDMLILQFSEKQQLRIPLTSIQLIFFQSGRFTYISDLPSDRYTIQPIPFFAESNLKDRETKLDRNQEGGPLIINGQAFYKGLGTLADTEIVVDLQGEFQRFQACVGLDDLVRRRIETNRLSVGGTVIFQVWVDGQKKFDSGFLRCKDDNMQQIDLDISSAKKLILRTCHYEDEINLNNYANWCGARLIKN